MMSLKLSEDATTIVAILFLLYPVSIHEPFPSAKSKLLTCAGKLLEREMKIAVHFICTKRNVDSIVPP